MKKEEWEILEAYVTSRMKEVYGEWDASLTVGSGNKLDDGDSKSPDWVLECKHTGQTQNINILRKWLDKVHDQALRYGKEWGLVRQANDSPITITIEFDIFIELLKGELNGKRIKGIETRLGEHRQDDRQNSNRGSGTDNGSGTEDESTEESNSECEQKAWKRDDYDRYTSGESDPHGTSSFRPADKTVRRRRISKLRTRQGSVHHDMGEE